MQSKASLVARLLQGLIFFVFGLNGFLQFLPQPPLPEPALAFMGALAQTGYTWPVVFGLEAICGALLLTNQFVPLALTLLAPLIVNIVLFHLALAPAGSGPAILVLALELFLARSYREKFQALLSRR